MQSDELSPGPWERIHKELGVTMPAANDRPLSAYVAHYAETIPDNIALSYYDCTISYSELDRLANQLANTLVGLGLRQGDVIGLHLPNIPQYVIAMLAASKIGAAISGVSAALAAVEIAQQIEAAGIKVLISLDALAGTILPAIETLPTCLTSVIVAGAEDFLHPQELQLPDLAGVSCHAYRELTAAAETGFEQADLPADYIAFIQFTGGTTGPAKGAQLMMQRTMRNASVSQVYCPWNIGQETAASALPLFHIAGTIFLLISLSHGARFLLIPNPQDTEYFCRQMIAHPPTRIGAVPTLYQQIADHALSSEIDFSKLVFAMTGSAPITGNDRARTERMLNGVVLSDSYGMTETGPAIVANPPARCKPEAVGIPLPGIDVRIVDVETGTQEMPYGEPGEVIVATPCLMQGYLNRPEETAHAVRQWRGKTWMHTGDVGVMDEDGYVYLRDRTKDMIIVSGFKVFSNEVENTLSALDCIAISALIGTPDAARPGSEIVNLYVELTADAKQRDAGDVRTEILEFCEANLARYKKPKAIHFLDAIPLTRVGKVDKKALRAKAQTAS